MAMPRGVCEHVVSSEQLDWETKAILSQHCILHMGDDSVVHDRRQWAENGDPNHEESPIAIFWESSSL